MSEHEKALAAGIHAAGMEGFDHIEERMNDFLATYLPLHTVAVVEKERLRFEGDLDKWMKMIGAGITGYQPEAYVLMDMACEELVRTRAENVRLRDALKIFADEAMIYDPPDGDDNHMAWSADFPIGALRKARASLASEPTE